MIPESFKDIKKIYYATQLEYSEIPQLKQLADFAYRLKVPFELLHVYTDHQLDLTDDHQLIQEIKEAFPFVEVKMTAYRSNRVVESILERIGNDALLALTTHHRGFLDGILNPSTSKKAVQKANVPVLVYRF